MGGSSKKFFPEDESVSRRPLTKNFYPPPPSAVGLYRAFLSEFFEVFFRFLCSQDGFLTLREGEAAPSNSGTCILTFVFMHFDAFIAGRKMLFLVS